MNMLRIAVLSAVMAGLLGAARIEAVLASPERVRAGVAAQVTVVATIRDAALIPGSVQLQQVDEGGRVLALMGTLSELNDGRYSIQAVIRQAASGTIILRVSSASRGSLTRSFSAPLVLTVER